MDPATHRTSVAVAEGDGIGPEISQATRRVLDAAGARVDWHPVTLGYQAYLEGVESGVPDSAWDVIRRQKVLLKGPIMTPQGGGYKSVNVTLRKSLGLYANVRETKAYAPYVPTQHPAMDVVVIRENEEDLYAGIEHRQTREVMQSLKLISRPGTERVVRYAFAYARAYGRKKITCLTKDNIMKFTDGLFHRVFDEVAAEYDDIEAEHMILDIGAARLADRPEDFDVVVTLNLYGDVLSDVTAQLAGSVGLAGSANVGDSVAMFEAVHGTAPDIAGKGIANPSGLLMAAVQMLVHVGQADVAAHVENAWLRTLEDGVHTGDVYRAGTSRERVGTESFADAVIERLGLLPRHLAVVAYVESDVSIALSTPPSVDKVFRGVDVFLDWSAEARDPNRLGSALEAAAGPGGWRLEVITNRGVRVYPRGFTETATTDHWRCRFFRSGDGAPTFPQVLALLGDIDAAGFEVIKTEHLYDFDGEPGFSGVQG